MLFYSAQRPFNRVTAVLEILVSLFHKVQAAFDPAESGFLRRFDKLLNRRNVTVENEVGYYDICPLPRFDGQKKV